MKTPLSFLLAITLLLPLPAEAGKLTGTFNLRKGDKAFARSTWTLVIRSDKSVIGSGTTKQGKRKVIFAGFIQLSKDYGVQKFRVRIGGKVLRTSFLFQYKKAFKVRQTRGTKGVVSEITVDPKAVLLDKNLFFPYVVLVRRYNLTKKGSQSFPFYVVSTKTGGTLNVAYQAISEGPGKHLLTVSGMGWTAKLTIGNRRRLLKVELDDIIALHPSIKPAPKKP